MNFCVKQLDKKIEVILSTGIIYTHISNIYGTQTLKPAEAPQDIPSWILMAKYEEDQSATTGRLALEDDTRLLITAGGVSPTWAGLTP